MAVAADAFARTASADAEAAHGVVRITASDVIGAEVLPPILAALREANPGLTLELNLSNRTEDLLRQEADIAVRMVRPAQAAIVARRVGVVNLGLFAHKSYLEKHGAPQTLDDLAGFALIGPDRETHYLSLFGLNLRRETFAFRTDSQLAQLAAIRAGLGVGVCQVALGRRSPDLVHILPSGFSHGMETWVAMHEDLRRIGRVRTAFNHLVRALTGYAAEGAVQG